MYINKYLINKRKKNLKMLMPKAYLYRSLPHHGEATLG